MNAKSLTILGIGTIVTALVAMLTLSKSEMLVQATQEHAKLFPNLMASINDVDKVIVKRKDGEYALERKGETWGLAEKGDYPVEMESVRKALIAVANMTTIEGKTSDPSRYDALGVQDPDKEGSKSVLLTLKDKAGKELAALIVGKEHDVKGSMSAQRYVRKPGEAQSWLVDGNVELKEKASDWLQKKILEVKRDRIRSVEVTQPEGELLAVDRAVPEQNDFTLVDIPEGKELIYPTAPGSLSSGLEYVNLDDVEPAGKVDFSQAPGPSAKFKTFDGLVVTVQTKDQDGKSYARFTASYEAPPPEPAKPADEKGDGDKPEDKKPAATKKTPEEVQKEVEDLNARLSPWTFQISSYSRATFAKKKSELLKDKAPPKPPEPTVVPGTEPKKDGADAPKDGDAFVIPGDLPDNVQEGIKKDLEAKGRKWVIGPPRKKPGDATPPAPGATPPAGGQTPPVNPPTPTPVPPAEPPKGDKPAETPPH